LSYVSRFGNEAGQAGTEKFVRNILGENEIESVLQHWIAETIPGYASAWVG